MCTAAERPSIELPGDPTIFARELSGREAASAALVELAEADALSDLDDDEPITQEFVVPRYTRADFDESVIEALVALEQGEPETEDPQIRAEVISFEDLRIMEALLEPYVDFSRCLV